ncbi:MAG: HDOD domain-containing protein [Candidatus Nitrohelix vancouverensis]|uniref:HDOD domain-containing protein n=1 Tax=Candidatus Nitrohelix vancouverensis TaxID=2705534 RepID=A0A7T0C265_9BACT|nr:MAG: HDOD domain-containing protein [Candidatus Nitrohelix vancouverensis]
MREKTLALLEQFKSQDSLPSLPTQIIRILEETSRSSSMDYNIIELIQYDPSMAMRVLKLANSPLYGYSGEIGSLQQAAGLLGPDALKNIILTTPILERYYDAERAALDLDFPVFWLHMQLKAAIAGRIARLRGQMEVDVCFTAGLIHETGKLALAIRAPALMKKIMTHAKDHNLFLTQAGVSVAEFSHLDIAVHLAEAGRLPKRLSQSLAVCDYDANADFASAIGAVVRLANYYAWRLGYPDGIEVKGPDKPLTAIAALEISEQNFDSWEEPLRVLAAETVEFLDY